MKSKIILYVGSLLLLLSGCSKDSAPENEKPTLTTGEATNVGRTSATISGSISMPESSEIKDCGFMYSTVSTLPEAESKTVSISLKGASSTYTTNLTGLTPNTRYYYRLYANSGYTKTLSSIRDFTTAADGTPTLEASTSISVTETSLTLASKIADDGGGTIQKFGFAYKASGSAEAERLVEAPNKESDGRYTFTITGLTAETSYDIRAFATNAKGTGYGANVTLATSAPETPILQVEAKDPGSTSIEISGKLTNENDLTAGITEVGFCLSKDKAEPTTADSKTISQLNGKAFSAIIKELTPETKYYIRAYAINKRTKTGYSAVVTFTTAKSAEPRLDATTAATVEETSVVLQCKITDNGGHDIVKFGFAYKTGGGTETQKEIPASELKADGSFQFTLTGLSPATAYEIRAFAVNSVGTGYGASCAVTTLAQKAPQVSVEAGTPEAHSVAVTGIIQSAGGTSSTVREVGFCWSKDNKAPTITDSKVISALDGVSFSSSITGLKAETKYYIRAYAINEAKVGYSNAVEITTATSDKPDIDDNVSPDK